jgi:hypothetical protein
MRPLPEAAAGHREELIMKTARATSRLLTAMSLSLCMGPASYARAQAPGTPAPPQAEAQTAGDVEAQRKAVEQHAQPDIEKQRKEAEQEAEKGLNADAAAAVTETQNARKAIAEDKPAEAMAAIERATGKIKILLARQPAAALLPTKVEVAVIDAAPLDRDAIKRIAKDAAKAVSDRDYPEARVLLQGLVSEIRVRTYNLPLATYPAALKEAARLLDQKQPQQAQAVLGTALDTLAVVDRVLPLPLLVAKTAIDDAEALRDKDRDVARRLLAVARAELERGKELGYAGNDPDYDGLSKQIAALDAQIKGNEGTGGAFARLRDRVGAFFRRQSASDHR